MTDLLEQLAPALPTSTVRELLAKMKWHMAFHKGQHPPPEPWRGWIIQAGRGFGKTLVGSIDVIEACLDTDHYRYGVVAPTLGDVRSTCLEGETGIIRMLTTGNYQMPGLGLVESVHFRYNRTLLEIEFANGSSVKSFGSERPDRLRGPQHHRLWFEELASFRDAWKGDTAETAFNNAMLGLRLQGKGPTKYLVTTTPRPLKLIVELAGRSNVSVTRGSTYDNLANLDEEFAEAILAYTGTHLDRQELMGEIVLDHPDALWRYAWIDEQRMAEPPVMLTIVVGVDPAGGGGDEIGIVAAGRIQSPCPCGGEDVKGPHFMVLEDASLKASPEGWGQRVVSTYGKWEADLVVAEQNYGGEMVRSTMRNVDTTLPVKMVQASRGKAIRAEPIVVLYEQKRVHHLGAHPDLESQYTGWVPGMGWSPDRLDAAVWALTHLSGRVTGPATVRAPSGILQVQR